MLHMSPRPDVFIFHFLPEGWGVVGAKDGNA